MKTKQYTSVSVLLIIQLWAGSVCGQSDTGMMTEQYRPQVHFSPTANWINDPNGMVYTDGLYHLFFQYNPYSTVWGPMHWGHATSPDMIHWSQRPIAIYPDSLGTIFSGSAVVDKNNTSGFGRNGRAPLVAIFTQHNAAAERAGRNDYQNQSIAYSNDNGETWTKFTGNPVIKNPGLKDFRDPKVMWYAAANKWIMTLASGDRVSFFSSPDLKTWTKESEFGKDAGAHGGGWECPDLFTLENNGKEIWVLIANLNPGGPNKGSGTQYFLGNFDGNKFTPFSTKTKWLDYGPDDYAGITWSNTGKRKIFLGWMSNWIYANVVPTEKWRNAMTIPRELTLTSVGDELFVCSTPVKELITDRLKATFFNSVVVTKSLDLTKKTGKVRNPFMVELTMETNKDFSLVFSNDLNEKLIVGFDKESNQYFIDRSKSGKVDFQKEFSGRFTAPRLTNRANMNISILVDESSAEFFSDDGLSVMTAIFFPSKPYTHVNIQTPAPVVFKKILLTPLKSIWQNK